MIPPDRPVFRFSGARNRGSAGATRRSYMRSPGRPFAAGKAVRLGSGEALGLALDGLVDAGDDEGGEIILDIEEGAP